MEYVPTILSLMMNELKKLITLKSQHKSYMLELIYSCFLIALGYRDKLAIFFNT